MLLRKKLPLTIILLVSIPLMFLSIVLYIYTSNEIEKISHDRIESVAALEGKTLVNLIEAQKREVKLAAGIYEIRKLLEAYKNSQTADRDSDIFIRASDTLERRLQESPVLQNVFIANPKGIILASGNKDATNYDINDRQYFHDALKGNTVVSNILKSKLYGESVIVIATPVLDDNKNIIGILGNTINIEYFMNFIRNIEISDSRQAYLIDAEGTIIAHTIEKKIGEKTVNIKFVEELQKLKNNEKLSVEEIKYTLKGKEICAFYRGIPGVNWLLVVEQGTLEIHRPAYVILGITLLTTLACLSISIISGMRFSESITTPMEELTETMSLAANGDLSVKCNFESNNEFGQLSKNFNTMLKKLNMSYEELTAVYEELSATEEELRAQYDELQCNEEALRNSEERYRMALEGANDVLWEWDLNTKGFFASDKWYDLMGYEAENKLDMETMIKYIHEEDRDRAVKEFTDHIEGRCGFYSSEFRIKTSNGSYIWVYVRGKALFNPEGKAIKLAGSLSDVSMRKKVEEEIKFMAYYDSLTKLPNRTMFMEQLEAELDKGRESCVSGAVMFLDLDNFKNINDTMGHDYGDSLLAVIASELMTSIDENTTVCRFGGDEFIILKQNTWSKDEIAWFAKEILNNFREPFEVSGKPTYITASIGIAVYPENGTDTTVFSKMQILQCIRQRAAEKTNMSFSMRNCIKDLKEKQELSMP